MAKSLDQLEREISELRAALRRGDFYIKHAAKHNTGAQDEVAAGGSITVEDGTTTVTNVTDIVFSAGTVAGTTGTATVTTTGGGASAGEPFITMAATSGLSAERVLTEGAGILIQDGGANSTVTVSARIREIQLSLGELFGYTI